MADKFRDDFNRIATELDILEGTMSQEIYVTLMKDLYFFEQPDVQEAGDTVTFNQWQLVLQAYKILAANWSDTNKALYIKTQSLFNFLAYLMNIDELLVKPPDPFALAQTLNRSCDK